MQWETQWNIFYIQQDCVNVYSYALESHICKLEQQLIQHQEELHPIHQLDRGSRALIQDTMPVVIGNKQESAPAQGSTAYSPGQQYKYTQGQLPIVLSQGQYQQHLQGWPNQTSYRWSGPQFSNTQLLPPYIGPHFSTLYMPQFPAASHTDQVQTYNAPLQGGYLQQDFSYNLDSYNHQQFNDGGQCCWCLKPDEVMIFDPKDMDVLFFTHQLQVIVLQEEEQPVLAVLPFCLQGQVLEWHIQLPTETQIDMVLSLS